MAQAENADTRRYVRNKIHAPTVPAGRRRPDAETGAGAGAHERSWSSPRTAAMVAAAKANASKAALRAGVHGATTGALQGGDYAVFKQHSALGPGPRSGALAAAHGNGRASSSASTASASVSSAPAASSALQTEDSVLGFFFGSASAALAKSVSGIVPEARAAPYEDQLRGMSFLSKTSDTSPLLRETSDVDGMQATLECDLVGEATVTARRISLERPSPRSPREEKEEEVEEEEEEQEEEQEEEEEEEEGLRKANAVKEEGEEVEGSVKANAVNGEDSERDRAPPEAPPTAQGVSSVQSGPERSSQEPPSGAAQDTPLQAPVCPCSVKDMPHDMVVSDGGSDMVVSEGESYYRYSCDICEREQSGSRWHCWQCNTDYCFACRPHVPAAALLAVGIRTQHPGDENSKSPVQGGALGQRHLEKMERMGVEAIHNNLEAAESAQQTHLSCDRERREAHSKELRDLHKKLAEQETFYREFYREQQETQSQELRKLRKLLVERERDQIQSEERIAQHRDAMQRALDDAGRCQDALQLAQGELETSKLRLEAEHLARVDAEHKLELLTEQAAQGLARVSEELQLERDRRERDVAKAREDAQKSNLTAQEIERDFYLIEEERRTLQLEREGLEQMKKAVQVESDKLGFMSEQIPTQIQTALEAERNRLRAVLLLAGKASTEQLLHAQVRVRSALHNQSINHRVCHAVAFEHLTMWFRRSFCKQVSLSGTLLHSSARTKRGAEQS